MIVSSLPIWIVDVGGAVLTILLSLLCLVTAWRLKKQDPNTVIWVYIYWVCIAMTVFAISRSVGHILQQALLLTDHASIWREIGPYSGAVNTITFVVVGSVTLFFERTWQIYQEMMKNQSRLQAAHGQLLDLNQNLEQLVAKRTEALTASEYKYRRIFEASRDGIMLTDPDGRILDINPSGESLLGIQSREPGQRPCLTDYLNTDDWVALTSILKTQGFVAGREFDMGTGNGEKRRVLISASKMDAASIEKNTIHLLIKDIEQQHRLREKMAQADKLASIGEFSSGIAHEINNPLGIILGYTQLMLRNEGQDSQRRADLKTIEKHVRTCKSIVEDLLNFARQSKAEKTITAINGVLADVLQFVRHHSRLDTIEFKEIYAENLPELRIDKKKIKQVFINLIMNAVHAVGIEGRIEIRTFPDQKGEKVNITVSDNGHGINPENLPRIFDPFFTTKPNDKGTGLGLSVSYGIIRHHGGDISVTSEPGSGTVFTVELPVSDTKEETRFAGHNSGR